MSADLSDGSLMVKVCGITRREDAEAAVAAGADAIGFIFFPESPRYLEPARATQLAAGLDVLKVGIFVGETAGLVQAAAKVAKLDVVQLYGGGTPEGLRVWRAFRMNQPFNPAEALGAEAVLLDGPANGIQFDWSEARKQWAGPDGHGCVPKLIVAGGLNSSNVAEAIQITRPWGVDASSGLEIKPGIKDPAKVRAFVKAAKLAAADLASETVGDRA